MEMKMCKLLINEEEYEYPYETSYTKIAADLSGKTPYDVLLVEEDGRLRELHHKTHHDHVIRLLTYKDAAGYNAYVHSLVLLMLSAAKNISSDKNYEISVHYKVSGGLYCTMEDASYVTDEFLSALYARMQYLKQQDYPIIKKTMRTMDAIRLFKEYGLTDKEKLMHYRLVSNTNVYELDGYVNYFYGYMLPSTHLLKHFSLVKYQDGFVLCFPRQDDPHVIPVFSPIEKLFQVQKQALSWGESIGILEVSDLNDRIVNGNTKELILMQEAYHEKQVASIAHEIASNPEKKIVLIAGPSSSGKTTFSHRLSIQLSAYGLKPHPIPVDDYFVNREDTPLDEDGKPDYECLEAIDIQQFNEDMCSLLAGKETQLPTYNFKTGRREYNGKSLQLGNEDILVIEGIHCLNDKLTYALPKESRFRIYISALTQLNIDQHNRIPTTDGRLIRRMVRDARTRGTSAEKTLSMWASVRRGEEKHIFPNQESADIMFNSALIYELAVLKVYADPLLFGIMPDSPHYNEARRLLKFMDYFVPMTVDNIPQNSLAREFVGGGCFDI